MAAVDLIIFGANGDLSARKLFPALFQLHRAGRLPADLRIAAVSREKEDSNAFGSRLRERLNVAMADSAPTDKEWPEFQNRLSHIAADFSSVEDFKSLKSWLDDQRVSLFYLATPPALFSPICDHLAQTDCLTGDCRIVLEKPIGECLESSRTVNDTIARYFDEKSIYRIDH